MTTNWEVVIGLETHAQLSTASKIFSGASTAFGASPNSQASAVDIALPGVLPVLNRGAVERAIRFGLAIGAIPAKHVPAVVKLLTEAFQRERLEHESFRDWTQRVGRRHVKELVGDLTEVASFEEAPELYRDWGDPRVFTIGDIGIGECAGEVISPAQFAFAESERLVFDAQLRLDDGDAEGAEQRALLAMTAAARAVCLPLDPSLAENVDDVGACFDAKLGRSGAFDAASPGGAKPKPNVRPAYASAAEPPPQSPASGASATGFAPLGLMSGRGLY